MDGTNNIHINKDWERNGLRSDRWQRMSAESLSFDCVRCERNTKETNKQIRKKYQTNKEAKSWVRCLGENHSNNPHLSIRHFLGEKNQTKMESEPSNCMFYLLLSFLFVKKKVPKSSNNLLCFILQNTLPSLHIFFSGK